MLAYDCACEAELADAIEAAFDAGELPDLDRLGERFKQDRVAIADVAVALTPLFADDELAAFGRQMPSPFGREVWHEETTDSIDAARLELLVADQRLPSIEVEKLTDQSDSESWPAAPFLAALAAYAAAERSRRRNERHLAEARLPVGETLASFDFEAVAMVSKAQLTAFRRRWVARKERQFALARPTGAGKTHLSVIRRCASSLLARARSVRCAK